MKSRLSVPHGANLYTVVVSSNSQQFLQPFNSVGRVIKRAYNVTFQHKKRLYQGQGLWWRFNSGRLRMADDRVTSRPIKETFVDNFLYYYDIGSEMICQFKLAWRWLQTIIICWMCSAVTNCYVSAEIFCWNNWKKTKADNELANTGLPWGWTLKWWMWWWCLW